MAVGNMIAQWRKEKGWTQERLAEASGCDRSYISQVEHGHVTPGAGFLVAVAGALNVNVLDILRAAGLARQAAVDEDHIAEMIAAYPRLAGVFEWAREHNDRRLLIDLERYADMLIREVEAEHGGEQGSGTVVEDRG